MSFLFAPSAIHSGVLALAGGGEDPCGVLYSKQASVLTARTLSFYKGSWGSTGRAWLEASRQVILKETTEEHFPCSTSH